MNRSILLLLLSSVLPLTARADDASRRAKAEEMITLAHVDRMSQQVIDNLMQQTTLVTTQRSGGTLTPEKQAALADFQKKLSAVLEPQIGWKALEPSFVDIYAKAFTEDQLDAIIVFYKSPAGAALMEKMPEINQAANQLLQTKIVAMQGQVRQMFQDFQQSLAPAPALGPAAPEGAPKSAPPTLGPSPQK
jgi:hypothetical protein